MDLKHAEPAGVYIHIPFCVRKCYYCDFYSVTDRSLEHGFLNALMEEIDLSRTIPLLFDTIYLGGGTPSVFEAQDISRIINKLNETLKIQSDTEITMEVNPGTVNTRKLEDYKAAGINRINIGVQSFLDSNLNFIRRIHSGRDACEALISAGKAGFDNIGLDLIYGIPGQTPKSWLSDLSKAVEFEPEHLSCYMLTYESGTPMEEDRQKNRFKPVDDGSVCRLFDITIDFLKSHGYMQYEISNFARSISSKSRHNRKYWSSVPYLGLGPAAHSFFEPVRRWNHYSIKKYIKALNDSIPPVEEKELLTEEQLMLEAVYLGLRQTEGIDIPAFNKKFRVDFRSLFSELITHFKENRLMKFVETRCALTQKGMLFTDSITKSMSLMF